MSKAEKMCQESGRPVAVTQMRVEGVNFYERERTDQGGRPVRAANRTPRPVARLSACSQAFRKFHFLLQERGFTSHGRFSFL